MNVLKNRQYAHVRGFNYQPSWGSCGLETWGPAFKAATVAQEMARGKHHFPEINTLRIWLSLDAFLRYGEAAFMPRLETMLAAGDRLGLRFIVTLFNGWHSWPSFGGITREQVGHWLYPAPATDVFTPFIKAVVGRYAADPRVLLWDLCNEPFNSTADENDQKAILTWLTRVAACCHDCGVKAPLAVGAIPSLAAVRLLEPVSDVITWHPYYAFNAWVKSPAQFEANVDETVAFANTCGKALLATETCWGSLDDAKRVEIMRVELGALLHRGIGFTAHLLHHTLVADGHRPECGPITNAGYMAFVEADGTLRPHHGAFNEFCG